MSWLFMIALSGCSEKKKGCDTGFRPDSDGNCYPLEDGIEDGEIQSVSIGPEGVRTQDTLYATVMLSGEPVDTGLAPAEYPVQYRWYVDDLEATGTANHLHGWKYFDKGQAVRLSVEPLGGGDGVSSNTIVIANTPPPAPGVDLYPKEPLASVDSLRCAITGVGDFDEDEITYTFEWTRNGEAWVSTPQPPMDDGGDPPGWDTGELSPQPPPEPSEVPASILQAGEVWVCHVYAFDGEDRSPTVTDQVIIRSGVSAFHDSTANLSGEALLKSPLSSHRLQ